MARAESSLVIVKCERAPSGGRSGGWLGVGFLESVRLGNKTRDSLVFWEVKNIRFALVRLTSSRVELLAVLYDDSFEAVATP